MAATWRRYILLALAAVAADGLMTPSLDRILPQSVRPLHDQALTMPEQKLAFCVIEKVASEHFGPLFNAVNNISITNDDGTLNTRASSVFNLGLEWSDITREAGWRFAMFVRHPLERYLSAFLDKCVPDGARPGPDNGGIYCYGPTLWAPTTLEEKVALFEERVRRDLANGLPENGHWLSQYSVMQRSCGRSRFAPADLDFLGHITYDMNDVSRQVKDMLRLTSLPETTALAEAHFPAASASALIQCHPFLHCSTEHKTFLDFYRKPETVQGAMRLFQDDFDRYPFPPLDFNFSFALPSLEGKAK